MDVSYIPRIYPNLNSSAAVPVDREQIFTLHSFAENYRLVRGSEHGQYVPNSRYVFVTMMTGKTLLHPYFRHPALAEGKPVLYAGEASFNNGRLDWWSNGSGNYRPDASHAVQAGLPMNRFFSFEDILKGVHKRAHTPQTKKSGRTAGSVQAKLAPASESLCMSKFGTSHSQSGTDQFARLDIRDRG